MSRSEVVDAIRQDPSLLRESALVEVLREVVAELLADGLHALPRKPKRTTEAKEHRLVDGWMTYEHVATLPGVTLGTVRSWVSRGNVQGGEGFVLAEDLMRYLTRPEQNNKQQAAACRLREILNAC